MSSYGARVRRAAPYRTIIPPKCWTHAFKNVLFFLFYFIFLFLFFFLAKGRWLVAAAAGDTSLRSVVSRMMKMTKPFRVSLQQTRTRIIDGTRDSSNSSSTDTNTPDRHIWARYYIREQWCDLFDQIDTVNYSPVDDRWTVFTVEHSASHSIIVYNKYTSNGGNWSRVCTVHVMQIVAIVGRWCLEKTGEWIRLFGYGNSIVINEKE